MTTQEAPTGITFDSIWEGLEELFPGLTPRAVDAHDQLREKDGCCHVRDMLLDALRKGGKTGDYDRAIELMNHPSLRVLIANQREGWIEYLSQAGPVES